MAQQVFNQTPFQEHTANGVTTVFAFSFQVLAAADMVVYRNSVLVPASEYTLAGLGVVAGGTVTFTVAPANAVKVLLTREIALERLTEYQTLGDFKAVVVNPDFNRLWQAMQGLNARINGSIRVPYPNATNALPDLAAFDGYYIGIAGGHPTFLLAPSGTAGALAGDLADTASLTKGAGLVGFLASLAYGTGTVGRWLKDLALTAGAGLIGFLNNSTGLVATTVQAAIVEITAQRRATVNIFPNTRWLLGTGLGASGKYNSGATGTLPTVTVTSYTTGANLITCLCADTSNLVTGMSLLAFNAPADINMRLGSTLRVLSIVANVSFTVRLDNGLTATSAACTASIYEVGGTGIPGSGNGFDGWKKSTTLEVWRDYFSTNLKDGSKYSCGMIKRNAATESYHVEFDARDIDQLRGKSIAAGGFIKCPTGGSWRVFVEDNINGRRYGAVVSTVGFSWSEVAYTIAAGVTTLTIGFELTGASGLPFYLSQPFAGQGTLIGSEGGPQPMRREYVVPTVKFSPYNFINANLTFPAGADGIGTYSFIFDPYSSTNGALAPEVRALDVILEGFNAAVVVIGSGGRALATRNSLTGVPDSMKFGPIMFPQVASVKQTVTGTLTLTLDGTGVMYSNVASSNWANFSMDINGMWL